MRKTAALIGYSKQIEDFLDLLFEKELFAYCVNAYIYYYGFSQEEIYNFIAENGMLPLCNRFGETLPLCDKLERLSHCHFNDVMSRGGLFNLIQQCAYICGIEDCCASSLRKTWAYNELCKGTDYSIIKRNFSYKGSLMGFFEYLSIDVEHINKNENLKKLYSRASRYNIALSE